MPDGVSAEGKGLHISNTSDWLGVDSALSDWFRMACTPVLTSLHLFLPMVSIQSRGGCKKMSMRLKASLSASTSAYRRAGIRSSINSQESCPSRLASVVFRYSDGSRGMPTRVDFGQCFTLTRTLCSRRPCGVAKIFEHQCLMLRLAV